MGTPVGSISTGRLWNSVIYGKRCIMECQHPSSQTLHFTERIQYSGSDQILVLLFQGGNKFYSRYCLSSKSPLCINCGFVLLLLRKNSSIFLEKGWASFKLVLQFCCSFFIEQQKCLAVAYSSLLRDKGDGILATPCW